MNVIQHTRSCSSYWAAICFYLINQPCALYIAFGTFFLVVKYFEFMKNSSHWYPSPCLKNDYKIGLLGNFGRIYGLLTSEAFFSCIASYRV